MILRDKLDLLLLVGGVMFIGHTPFEWDLFWVGVVWIGIAIMPWGR